MEVIRKCWNYLSHKIDIENWELSLNMNSGSELGGQLPNITIQLHRAKGISGNLLVISVLKRSLVLCFKFTVIKWRCM